jgi:hypothetical protein
MKCLMSSFKFQVSSFKLRADPLQLGTMHRHATWNLKLGTWNIDFIKYYSHLSRF